jgi:integrase
LSKGGKHFAGGGGRKGPPGDVDRYRFYKDTGGTMRVPVCSAPITTLRKRWLEEQVWARIEFALFLAERTGKRLGSIRQLRWEDFDFERQVVYWRAEADKKGYKWEVPMPTNSLNRSEHFSER